MRRCNSVGKTVSFGMWACRNPREDMIAGATVPLSSPLVRTPPEISALQEYGQISSGAESLFRLATPEDVFSEVHP
jgi:hypothetical protein